MPQPHEQFHSFPTSGLAVTIVNSGRSLVPYLVGQGAVVELVHLVLVHLVPYD